MAPKKKVGSMLIKLISQAGTGFFYITKKNPRNTPYKLQLMKYDPRVRSAWLWCCVCCCCGCCYWGDGMCMISNVQL